MSDSSASYMNFDVKITRIDDQTYLAQVIQSPVGQSLSNRFSPPLSDSDLAQLILLIEAGATQGSQDLPRKYGSMLFQTVFSEQMRNSLQRSYDLTRQQHKKLRLRFMLAEAPELHQIPWEYLYSSAWERFIAMSSDTPIVRYLEMDEPEGNLTADLPLTMLVIIANPQGTATLDVAGEWQKIQSALQPLVDQRLLTIERLETPTISALQQKLGKRGATYHIIHFIGHGTFDPNAQQSVLLFEKPDQTQDTVTGDEFGMVVRDHRPLRLVVLNACKSAQTGEHSALGGIAQVLMRQGIPAVVAMQYPLSDSVAKQFTGDFYTALLDEYPIDDAISSVRKSLFINDYALEWATPILFMRSLDGVLFRRAVAPALEVVATPEPVVESPPVVEVAPKPPIVETPPAVQAQVEPPAASAQHPIISVANIGSLKKIHSLTGHSKGIASIAIAPDSKTIASGSSAVMFQENQMLRLWSLETASQITALSAAPNGVYYLSFSPDNQRLLVATFTTLTEYNLQTKAIIWQQELDIGFGNALRVCCYSPNQRWFAVCSDDDLIRVWDANSHQQTATLRGHNHNVQALIFNQASTLLISGSADKTIRTWDLNTQQQTCQVATSSEVKAITLTRDDQLLIASDWNGKIYSWQFPTFEPKAVLDEIKQNVPALAISPDNQLLVAGYKNKFRIIELATGRTLSEFEAHTDGVTSICFAPNGSFIATGSLDQTIGIWAVA